MFRTCEIRWFFPTAPFERLLVLGGTAVSSPIRTDWYASPSNTRCGIKFREGRLEPKLLLKDNGVRAIGSAEGRMQYWAKWSLDFPNSDFPPDDMLAATNWIPVEKRRFLRSFKCEGGQVVEPKSQDVAQCHFEWTELRIGNTPWWTIGFEAFGRENLEHVLLSVVRHVFQGLGRASSFQEENSYSYPEWLCSLTSV
jgi:hypothetical protein